MSVDLDRLAARLSSEYGPDPTLVGMIDGTEDDFGDLMVEAAGELGVDVEAPGEWDHFQDVAIGCPATRMREWLEVLAAAVAAR